MKDKLLQILPLFMAIGTIAFSIVSIPEPEEAEVVENIVVNWGDAEYVEPKAQEVGFDYVMTDQEPEVDVISEEVSRVTATPGFVLGEDNQLINYAEKHIDFDSKNWTLSGVSYVDKEAPLDVPEVMQCNSKTYMKYQVLGTESWNKQGHLVRQKEATTGIYNLRMVDGRILIAVGTYYCTNIGTYIDVLLEDGRVIPCMLGDVKSNAHTDITNRYQAQDKSVIEFIIDSPGVNRYDYSDFKNSYPMIDGNFSRAPEFSSPVVGLRIYDKIYDINMADLSNSRGE